MGKNTQKGNTNRGRRQCYCYFTQDKFVIKRFKDHISQNLIKREINFYQSQNHDNIIKYIDHQKRQLILEYADSSLCQLKHADQNFISHIIQSITQGLIELKNNGIIHRDIKRQNILITNKNQIKICDIGLFTYKINLYTYQHLIGTKKYISPQMATKSNYDLKQMFGHLEWYFIYCYQTNTPSDNHKCLKRLQINHTQSQKTSVRSKVKHY